VSGERCAKALSPCLRWCFILDLSGRYPEKV
jgi:hypothetical protein